MLDIKDAKVAIPVVLVAGLLWSFGPYVVRHIDGAQQVPWQYLFTRGIVIFLLLNLFLFFEEGRNFYKNYFKVGISGLIGGIGLGIAMTTFIWSITNTTAAITLLCLAAMPFITALLGFLLLKKQISINVWISIAIATFGIGVHLMTFFFGYLIHFYGFDFGFKTCSIFIFSITLMLFIKEKKYNE